MSQLGPIHHRAGRYQEAYAACQESLALWDALGDNFGRADVSRQLSITADVMGDKRSSTFFASQASGLWRLLGDRRAEAMFLQDQIWAVHRQENHLEVINILQQVLSLREQLGDSGVVASTLGQLSGSYVALGRFEEARTAANVPSGFARCKGTSAPWPQRWLASLTY